MSRSRTPAAGRGSCCCRRSSASTTTSRTPRGGWPSWATSCSRRSSTGARIPGYGSARTRCEQAFAAAQRLVHNTAVHDAIAALATLRDLPEVAGKPAGVLGFCLGGTLAWQVAANGDPDVAVCYYGSGIPGFLEDADEIACPVLLHFGGADPYIPREDVDAVAAMAAKHDAIECHVQEGAGHAFDNSFAPQFSNPRGRGGGVGDHEGVPGAHAACRLIRRR